MEKPVWRMNTGIEPKDKTRHVVFYGELDSIRCGDGWEWAIDGISCLNIYAYQTTRTREAKR